MKLFGGTAKQKKKKGLFLTGGGARGAYQAGVLKAIAEIINQQVIPFGVVSAMSAGSINSAFIVARGDNFREAAKALVEVWANLSSDQVFKTSTTDLLLSAARTLIEVATHRTPKHGQFLLDSSPLLTLIERHIDFEKLNYHIKTGLVEAFDVASLCYNTGNIISFYNSKKHRNNKKKYRYCPMLTQFEGKHIQASGAIPLFFRPVEINNQYYGDGSLRNFHPLRSAIGLGANSLLVIDVKNPLLTLSGNTPVKAEGVSFGRIIDLFFNSVFLDNVDRDIELFNTINSNVHELREKEQSKMDFREIELLHIRPSQDLGALAAEYEMALPRLLRYLLSAFGSKEQSCDIISYLLFEAEYCCRLTKVGYQDGMAQQEEIDRFFK